nr:hypothetical protein RSP673_04375 [Ralstonia solanacearum P673]
MGGTTRIVPSRGFAAAFPTTRPSSLENHDFAVIHRRSIIDSFAVRSTSAVAASLAV